MVAGVGIGLVVSFLVIVIIKITRTKKGSGNVPKMLENGKLS